MRYDIKCRMLGIRKRIVRNYVGLCFINIKCDLLSPLENHSVM